MDNSCCWTPELSVGIRELDEDHKKLFQLLNEASLLVNGGNYERAVLQGLV